MTPIVSAIIQKINDQNQIEILIQERWKPKLSPHYSGLLEIPAGGIKDSEDVFSAVKREVKEETGLDAVKFINSYKSNAYIDREDEVIAFQSFLCQQMVKTKNGRHWIGFVFLCEAEGQLKTQSDEARNFRWITIKDLQKELKNNLSQFFSLQVPVLKYYINSLN